MKLLEKTYARSFKNDIEFNERRIAYGYLSKLRKKYQKKFKRFYKKIQRYRNSDFELIFDRRYLKVNEWQARMEYYSDMSTLLDEKMNEIDEME